MEFKLVQKSPLEKQCYTMHLFLVLDNASNMISFAVPTIIISKDGHPESTCYIVSRNYILTFLETHVLFNEGQAASRIYLDIFTFWFTFDLESLVYDQAKKLTGKW